MTIETVGVIGTGAMGSGIIEVAAKAGVAVVAHDINAAAIEAGKTRVEGSLDKAVARGKTRRKRPRSNRRANHLDHRPRRHERMPTSR